MEKDILRISSFEKAQLNRNEKSYKKSKSSAKRKSGKKSSLEEQKKKRIRKTIIHDWCCSSVLDDISFKKLMV